MKIAVMGYSGSGKKMIAGYEDENRDKLFDAPRQYGITQNHKHLKEMKAITGLENKPVFCPIVGDFYSGMEVTVPLFKEDLAEGFTIEDVKNAYKEKYKGSIIKYVENDDKDGFYSSADMSGFDNMKISVDGNEERMILVARYDNLGKGASGAAIECMNYKLGKNITDGLDIKEC